MVYPQTRLTRLVYLLAAAVLLQFGLTCWLLLSRTAPPPSVAAQTAPLVLRARGLVIEDAQGRPRILLGAPFPAAPGRVRHDATSTAILFLDPSGHDRLTLGEELDPQIGGKVPTGIHRIASGYGVVLHDTMGDERGAYSWLTNGRALLTLDRPGAEAFAAVVNDKTGEAKLALSFPPAIANDRSAIELGTQANRAFIEFKSSTGTAISSEQTCDGLPPLHIANNAGAAQHKTCPPARH